MLFYLVHAGYRVYYLGGYFACKALIVLVFDLNCLIEEKIKNMKNNGIEVSGNLVDVVSSKIFKAKMTLENGRIKKIEEVDNCPDTYIVPGIVDAHVHIESSMLVPQQFARIAVKHGTVSTVSDPHEIANVLGVEGINFMLEDSKKVPFKFYFGVPSCVPATGFETSGFVLSSKEVELLLMKDEFKYLSEMMNFPGVVYHDPEVMKKLTIARNLFKPIDGHAPGLRGEQLEKYASAGITTDHESVDAAEAIEKIKLGIKLQIREGSAAKNFDSLISVISAYPDDIMLCTDDCHPDDLIEKHILNLVKRALKKGYNFFDVLRAATYNPVKHYSLDVGLLQAGDPADFIIVDNVKDLNVLSTYINGEMVYNGFQTLIEYSQTLAVNNFACVPISINDIQLKMQGERVKVILAQDGDLYTGTELVVPKVSGNLIVSDPIKDILKIVLVNRYSVSKPVVGLIKNFNLKKGAIAGSISHDSHNIIAVGVSDEDILGAVNEVIRLKGGIVAKCGDDILSLPLPVAGLMSDEDGEKVAIKYKSLNKKPKEWGCTLHAPFMTLSFMALLVIPELKIGDKGMFDGNEFKLTSLFV
jgi:adenine deaminase